MTSPPTGKKTSTSAPTADPQKIDPAKFPNLAAESDWDREQHIKQAMKSGLTRKQAEKHADDELREG